MKKVEICGREYTIKFTNEDGGCFWVQGSHGKGNGEIHIGNYEDLRFCVEIIAHEFFEAICVEMGKRLQPFSNMQDHTRYTFPLTHDDLNVLIPLWLTALLQSGFIKLVDARPKKKGKK